jgi:acyl carrier protein
MSASIEIDEVVEILEEATLSLPASIGPDTQLQELKGLDSMGMVSFVAMIQDYTGKELAVADFLECRTPRDLLRVIQAAPAS